MKKNMLELYMRMVLEGMVKIFSLLLSIILFIVDTNDESHSPLLRKPQMKKYSKKEKAEAYARYISGEEESILGMHSQDNRNKGIFEVFPTNLVKGIRRKDTHDSYEKAHYGDYSNNSGRFI